MIFISKLQPAWNGVIECDIHELFWFLTGVSNKPHGISLTGISDTVFSIRAYFFQFTPKNKKNPIAFSYVVVFHLLVAVWICTDSEF